MKQRSLSTRSGTTAAATRIQRRLVLLIFLFPFCPASGGADDAPAISFRTTLQPMLARYCYECHGDGEKKGNLAFDELPADGARLRPELWLSVLKNVRAGLMPPINKPRPSPEECERLERWIKHEAFGIDPANPDPGRVTVRRLNRTEYRNTIRDLLGVDFDTPVEFPPDDTGYGFDNIAQVLTLSPMLLEKYLGAARTIVSQAVPATAGSAGGKFFPHAIPPNPVDRRSYARELLAGFATQAFRRPVDPATVDRLADLAEGVYTQPQQTFETGIAQAMVATLASPRFLFREEGMEPDPSGKGYPFVDEYALASRLSYFLWSSMPDAELFRLAGERKLKQHLAPQVTRMLADPRSEALVKNFTGQWLQARDVESIALDAPAVLAREAKPDPEAGRARQRLRALVAKPEATRSAAEKAELAKAGENFFKALKPAPPALDGELRRAMRREVEQYFDYLVHQDRPVVELLESDYTFLNERLASHYGLAHLNVTGPDLRRVELPADSPRGGVLTMGSVLLVTSNPTRTSPVKRGRFLLENILGNPTPPPPPNIPPLEDAEKELKDAEPTGREVMARHRRNPLCHSCHSRMDPPGFALENFNALGGWREQEHGVAITAAGQLSTGEVFQDVRELKHLLATAHRLEFYRTLTAKLLTYALGRGLDYHDVETVDQIVSRLEHEHGRFSALLAGVIESAPFQKCRAAATLAVAEPSRAGAVAREVKSDR